MADFDAQHKSNLTEPLLAKVRLTAGFGVLIGEIKMKHKKWAVQFPDGTLPGQYFYDTKRALQDFSPSAIYGDCSTWSRAKLDGYKIRRVEIQILK